MIGHPTREEDFDLYALGALDGDERQEMEQHLAVCADCTRKLSESKGRVAILALAASTVAPSAAAKAGLMARVHADTAQKQIVRNRVSAERASGITFSRWWAAILVPAVGVLAIATIVLWQQNARLNSQITALGDSVAKQRADLDTAKHLVDLIGSTDTVTVSLATQANMPKGSAHVMYNMKMGMLMYDGQLEAAPSGKSYQLWVVPAEGNPISAGVFNPVQGQMDHWTMNMPQGVVPKAFAVTIEPSGGMPQPTGPKVLVGAAS